MAKVKRTSWMTRLNLYSLGHPPPQRLSTTVSVHRQPAHRPNGSWETTKGYQWLQSNWPRQHPESSLQRLWHPTGRGPGLCSSKIRPYRPPARGLDQYRDRLQLSVTNVTAGHSRLAERSPLQREVPGCSAGIVEGNDAAALTCCITTHN